MKCYTRYPWSGYELFRILLFFLPLLNTPFFYVGAIRVAKIEKNLTVQSNLTGHTQVNQSKCVPPADFFPPSTSLLLLEDTNTHAAYVMGDDNEMSLFLYDCSLKKKLVFAHIPKNAGTTIAMAGTPIGMKWGGLFYNWNKRQDMPDGNSCSAWHVPPSLLKGYNPYWGPFVETFCVTRDPWDRMVSEYTYELKNSGVANWAWSAKKLAYPCTGHGFNQFVTIVLGKIEMGYKYIQDCHMVPQWDYVEGWDGRKWCDHRLELEHLTPQFNALMESKGLSIRLAPHNKGNPSSDECPELKDVQSKAPGILYSPANKAAMRRVYAKDFLHLGDSLRDT